MNWSGQLNPRIYIERRINLKVCQAALIYLHLEVSRNCLTKGIDVQEMQCPLHCFRIKIQNKSTTKILRVIVLLSF